MSIYLKRYEDNSTLTYPEDIFFIRKVIEEKYGTLTCSNHKLEELWRDFSEEEYAAGFLSPNENFIEEFVYWLEWLQED